MTINQKIFELLEKKGIKQAELAEYLKIGKSAVTNWKQRGNNPPVEYIVPICKLLNISVNELLDDYRENSFDTKLLKAYNEADQGTQAAVRKLLDIEEIEETSSDQKIG